MRNIKQKFFITSILVFYSFPSLSLAFCYDMEKEIACGNTQFPNQAGDYPEQIIPLVKQESGLIYDSVNRRWWLPCSQIDCSTPQAMNWANAQQHCQSITFQGKKWRLPTIIELNNLLRFHSQATKINLTLFPDSQPSSYWAVNTSLTSKKNSQPKAWFIHFASGSIFDTPKTDKHLVRCVSHTE